MTQSNKNKLAKYKTIHANLNLNISLEYEPREPLKSVATFC